MRRLSPLDACDVKARRWHFLVWNVTQPFHHREDRAVGPLAMVVPDGKADLVARVVGILASADRPMRVFRKVAPARSWIESLAK